MKKIKIFGSILFILCLLGGSAFAISNSDIIKTTTTSGVTEKQPINIDGLKGEISLMGDTISVISKQDSSTNDKYEGLAGIQRYVKDNALDNWVENKLIPGNYRIVYDGQSWHLQKATYVNKVEPCSTGHGGKYNRYFVTPSQVIKTPRKLCTYEKLDWVDVDLTKPVQ